MIRNKLLIDGTAYKIFIDGVAYNLCAVGQEEVVPNTATEKDASSSASTDEERSTIE